MNKYKIATIFLLSLINLIFCIGFHFMTFIIGWGLAPVNIWAIIELSTGISVISGIFIVLIQSINIYR